nr:MAG: hypothetical protein DIU57_09895 [Pseudomonadota bacterium]
MVRNLAPVAVYTYTRINHLKRTIEALKNNLLAKYTVLYVVSDGPRTPADEKLVEAIRNYVDDLSGFREVVRLYRSANLGTPASIFAAEQQIISDHGKIICMEDDNVTSTNFLSFLNQGLQHFEGDDRIFSVCGYMPPVAGEVRCRGDYWLYPWNISWGYATWKDRYDRIYPLVNEFVRLKRNGVLRRLNAAGGLYITDSLRRDYRKQRRFPDAILCTRMFELGMCSVVPTVSKVLNIGSDGSGVSSLKKTTKYDVELDSSNRSVFDFHCESEDSAWLRRRCIRFFNGSIATRIARRLGVYGELLAAGDRLRALFKS